MDICFLGTAPGLPLMDRFGQTIVVTTRDADVAGGTNCYLLDAGDGASSLLVRHGFDHLAVRAVVISHMHADHHCGFTQFIKTNMHLRRQEELVVVAPAEGLPAIKAYLNASYLHEEWLGYPIRWASLAGVTRSDGFELPGDMRLSGYSNGHLTPARERLAAEGTVDHTHTFESYSIALEHAGIRVVYSGNLLGASGADEMATFVEPADLLICELAHLDPVELGRFLANRRIGQTALAHFHPKWQGVPDADIRALLQAGASDVGSPGDIILARDGDVCTATPHMTAATIHT